jgi:hypothetical protein
MLKSLRCTRVLCRQFTKNKTNTQVPVESDSKRTSLKSAPGDLVSSLTV